MTADLDKNCTLSEFKAWTNAFVTNNVDKLSSTFHLNAQLREILDGYMLQVLNVNRSETGITFEDQAMVLTLARILSRDRFNFEFLRQPKILDCFTRHSGLSDIPNSLEAVAVEVQPPLSDGPRGCAVAVEALKVLSNLALQSDSVVDQFSREYLPEAILNRTRIYQAASVPLSVHYFDMRLLFLLTAKNQISRARLTNQSTAFSFLLDSFEICISTDGEEPISSEIIECSCEYLKVLFNLSSNARSIGVNFVPGSGASSEESMCIDECGAEFNRMVSLLSRLLLRPCNLPSRADEVMIHSINLLTSVPGRACTGLLLPRTSASADGDSFEEHDLRIISRFLDHMERLLANKDGDWRINLMTLTNALCNACQQVRPIRKYCRLRVLPPLSASDLKKLPEEGNTLRNRLCVLLTSPYRNIKQSVALFLFVLCKENASRAVKYTGYGNFSGFLAGIGLMAGGRSEASAALYSSESSDSDNEEYEQMRKQINPVTGRWERPKPNPMEGMSEERKEYEACRLMEHIDKLQRSGVIQPGIIDDDGRVRPARHVLELAEQVNEQQRRMRGATSHSSDSDVD